MWEEIKEKFKNSECYPECVQILTLFPSTIERTINELETTNYLVKKSRAVKKENGILGLCDRKQGKALANELNEEILQFYESDENSRMCPGKNDTVSIRNKDGDKIKHQKRLVLSNLCELYATWKRPIHPRKWDSPHSLLNVLNIVSLPVLQEHMLSVFVNITKTLN